MKRFIALENCAVASLDLGMTASDMTGSGTFMDVIVYLNMHDISLHVSNLTPHTNASSQGKACA